MSVRHLRITRREATPEDQELARTVHHAAYRQVVMKQFGEWNQAEQDGFFTRAWYPTATEVLLADQHLADTSLLRSVPPTFTCERSSFTPTGKARVSAPRFP